MCIDIKLLYITRLYHVNVIHNFPIANLDTKISVASFPIVFTGMGLVCKYIVNNMLCVIYPEVWDLDKGFKQLLKSYQLNFKVTQSFIMLQFDKSHNFALHVLQL